MNSDFSNGEPAEDYGYYSDSDLEDDGDGEEPGPAYDVSRTATPPHSPGGGGAYHANHAELTNKGKVVSIPDIAAFGT